LNVFRECIEKIQVLLKSDINNGHFSLRSFHIHDMSLNLPRIINLSGKSCIENHETAFVFYNFSPENHTLYETFCTAGQATNDNIIRRLRFACWITKNTNILSEYVIQTAFPKQEWLRERL
jgi:hypothetical protein